MEWILDAFSVAGVNADELSSAWKYGMSDFEDAIAAAAATSSECERIVTRNTHHFRKSPIQAVTPRQYLEFLGRDP